MKIIIDKSRASGTLNAPPSKSYAHRMMMCAALATGKSVIRGISESEDMLATLDCISALGAEYERDGDTVSIDARAGNADGLKRFYCRESGSTFRFFVPVALLFGGVSEFYGSPRLMERGVSVYKEVFADKNILFEGEADKLTVKGELKGGNYKVDASVSSQFISGLLFALPLAEEDSVIELLPPVESKSYIDITLDVLARFGVDVGYDGNTLRIKGGQRYTARTLNVEGDASNAAFLDAFNLIGGDVTVLGLERGGRQGDLAYSRFFADIKNGVPTVDLSDTPDLAPILFAMAAANGGGVFTGTRRLRLKESDRAEVMARELAKFGTRLTVEENRVTVDASVFGKPSEELDGHNDHRIVMALSVLLTLFGGTVNGAQAVRKSYPEFFDDLKKIGIAVKESV